MEKLFEKALKKGFRFKTSKGNLTTEDLWIIPLQSTDGINLDDIAKNLHKKLKESEEESFVTERNPYVEFNEKKLELVKYIIKVRLDDIEKSKQKQVNRTKNEKIDKIIERKKEAALENMSIEELEKLKK